MLSKIQYISQGLTAGEQLANIHKVLDQGYQWIQLRFKQHAPGVLLPLACEVRQLCDRYRAVFIVNDHPSVALESAADGVHLGLTDMPVAEARVLLGAGKLIGGTANTLEDVRQRLAEGCDYIGLGPYRFTPTKEHLSPVLGLEGYKAVLAGLNETQRAVPLYAIGGIRVEDIPLLTEAGIYGVAVSALLTQQQVNIHW